MPTGFTGPTGTAPSNDTWSGWVTSFSNFSASVTTATIAWNQWIGATTNATVTLRAAWPTAPPEERPIDRWRRERDRQRRAEAPWTERQEAIHKARRRARQSLHELIGTERFKEYVRGNGFEVRGSDGYLYRIFKGTSGNVKVYDPQTNEWLATICFHPTLYDGDGFSLPEADCHIAQALALMSDAEQALGVLNVHQGRLPDELAERREIARVARRQMQAA